MLAAARRQRVPHPAARCPEGHSGQRADQRHGEISLREGAVTRYTAETGMNFGVPGSLG